MTSAILLDTHVWVWLNNGSKELSKEVVAEINEAAHTSFVYISAISVWEFGILVSHKRLTVHTSPLQWVNEALARPGISILPLLPEISVESSFLPEAFHGDPADRILVASSRIKRIPLFTRDTKIINYAKDGHLKIRVA